jgi:hypothetical protein
MRLKNIFREVELPGLMNEESETIPQVVAQNILPPKSAI